jgi:CheY-like chemotaxis protein
MPGPPRAAAARPSDPDRSGELCVRQRVLIVDDEPEFVAILQEHFAGRYEVDTALSATEGVRAFESRRPNLVLLDINMPGVDGLKLLVFLRQADPAVPIIVITGNTSTPIAAQCIKAGAFGYVPKPCNLVYLEHLASASGLS